ncbi:hypothetical protein Tco_1385331 [Tanacetum coccineum]
MDKHSQKWHDGSSTRKICNNSSDGIAANTNKLDNLRWDMRKLKENIHAIQVGCEICGGMHLDKECPLKEKSHDDAIKNLDTKIGLQTNDIQVKILGGAPSSLTFVNHCKAIFTNDGLPLYMPFDYFFNETGDLYRMSLNRKYKKQKRLRSLTVRNALAELGASISIMSFSMHKRLDFVILDMIEDFRMPLILGRPLLETAHVEIDIFRKQISLDMGNEKLLFKLEDNLNEIRAPIESAYAVRDIELRMGYESFNILNIDDDLFLYNSTSCLKTTEFNYLLSIDEDIFTYDIVVQESDEERACG